MAQTYKFGNGTWANKEGSSLAYSDTNNAFKPLPFSFSRDSIGTRVNKEGLIEVVGKDIPRIDYTDSADGVLLLENSRSNAITNSETFGSTGWSSVTTGTALAPIVTNDYAISPDGTQNAQRIQFNLGGGSPSRTVIRQSIPTQTDWFLSVWMKSTDGTDQKILWHSTSDTNETIVTGEWQRFTFSRNGLSNSWAGLCLNGGVSTVDTADILVYGFQAEQGSYATSYIPTSGSTSQRAAETANGSGNSEVFSDSSGVLFVNIAALSDTVSTYNSIGVGSGLLSNRIGLGFEASNNIYVYKRDNSSNWLPATTMDIKLYNKIALSYNTNDNHFWLNGFKIASNTTVGDMSQPTSLGFEASYVGEHFYGKTKEIAYYNEILTDEELEYMTSYRSLNELVTELNLNTL